MIGIVVLVIVAIAGVVFLAIEIHRAPVRDDWDEPSQLDHRDGLRHPDQRDMP